MQEPQEPSRSNPIPERPLPPPLRRINSARHQNFSDRQGWARSRSSGARDDDDDDDDVNVSDDDYGDEHSLLYPNMSDGSRYVYTWLFLSDASLIFGWLCVI